MSLSIAAFMAWWVKSGWVGPYPEPIGNQFGGTVFNGQVYEGILKGVPLGVWGYGTWWEFHPIVGLFVLHACLMVSKTVRIPKP